VDDAIRGCARLLIAFIYDTVEKARRRALREMWLAAHESRDPNEFRARILDYLAEGDVAPLLERLTEERTFTYLHWTSALEEVLHVDDIREWRGSSGRLLGSYPDHPGLLLARSMSELLDPAGSLDEANAALVSSLQAARAKYGVDDATLGQLMTWAVQRCLRAVQIDAAVLVAAIGRQQLPAWRPPSALHGHQHPGAAILALESSLEQSLQYLEALTNGGYTP
jgi:ATP-dependent DNA helicase RecQ